MKKHFNFKSMYRTALVALCLMTVGVGEMWAGTKTVYVETTQCSTYDNVYIHYWDDGSGDQVATQITDYFWMASIPENAKWCVFRKVGGTGYNYLENVTNSDNFFYVVSFDQSKGNSHATTHLKTYDGSTYVYWRTNPANYNAWGDDNATLQIRLIRLDGDNLGFVNATDKDATSDHVARYLVPAGTYLRPELHTSKNNAYTKTFEFSSTASDNFIYDFKNNGGWANWATSYFSRSAYVYFDNTNSQWTDAYKEILVGRDGTSDTYNMTLIPNTNNLYCYTSGLTYNDFTQFCFIGNSSHWGQYNDNPNNRKGSANTNTDNYQALMDHSSRQYNLFIPAGTTKGTSLTHTAYGDYTSLNYTQTVEQKLSENGGDSYSTSTRALATVSVNSYKLNSATGTTADGGSITSGQSSKSCDAARTATVTYSVSSVAEGYTFVGWYDGDTQKSTSTTYTYQATEAKTITARFKANSYTVVFDGNDKTSGSMSNQTFYYNVAQNLTTNAYGKNGYNFGGWTTNNDGTGSSYTNGQSVSNWSSTDGASITIYAKWTQNVTLDLESGTSGSTSVTATYNSATLGSYDNPERSGYTFGGYYSGDDGTGELIINTSKALQASKSVDEDVYTGAGGIWKHSSATTLHAKWTPKEYTVRFENLAADEGHKGSLDTTVTYNDTINMKGKIEVPSKTYYTFGGYYISTDKGKTLTNIQIIDANGNWNKGVSGYTGTKDNVATWVCAGDTVLYAKWTETLHTITIASGGNGTVSPESVNVGGVTSSGEITATPNTGYHFRDWALPDGGIVTTHEETSSIDDTIHIKATASGTITANFIPNEYTVRFENLGADEGHKGSLDTTVTFNDTIHMKGKIEVPSKTNYDFGGYWIRNAEKTLTHQLIDANGYWIKDKSPYTGNDGGSHATWICAGDTVLYAQWIEKSHTVTVAVSAGAYDGTPGKVQISSADVTEVTAGEVTWSDVLTPIANPGWKFKEWQETSNIDLDLETYHRDYQTSGTNSMAIKASADGQTLTAVFEPRFELAGSKTATGDPAGGMPGWSYDGTGVFDPIILTDTCTLEANTSYKCSIHDRAAKGNYGDGTDGQYKLTEEYNAHCSKQNMNMLFNSTAAGKYLFKITGFDDDGRPYIRLYWPRQVNFGRRTVDIDGGTHNDDTGGTLSVKAADTTITSGTWHTYNTNVAYDADNKAGYQLTWYNSSSYTETFTAGGEWDHNLTGNDNSYAQFSELATKVSLENDGHGHVEIGGVTRTDTTCGVTTTRSLTAVPNTGYSFSSWTKPSGDDIEFNTAINPTTLRALGEGLQEGQRVYANFTAKTYSIKLNNDHSGESSDDGTATATYDATSLSVSDHADFTGWTLLGYWNSSAVQVTDEKGDLKANVDGYTDADGKWTNDAGETVNLWAHWSRSVTLDDNVSHEHNGSATVTYNSSAGQPTITTTPTRSDYAVEGYYTNAACTTKVMEANGKLMESVSGYTNAAGKWTKTDATTLYTKWVKRIYRTGDNGGTDESYSGSAIPTSIEFRMKVHEAGKWYSLCLPFTVDSVCVWDDEDGHYYRIVPYYRSGGNYYKGHYVIRTPNFSSGNSIAIANFDDWVDPSSSGNPSANTPYIIQWPNGYFRDKYISFFGKNASTWPNSMTAGDAPTDNSVVNVYGNATLVSGSVAGAYMLDNDYGVGAWLRLDDEDEERAIPPFECYILASSEVRSKYLVIRRDMTIEDTATGWEQLKDPSEGTSKVLIDGELFIIRGNLMYTIQGALVK